MAPYRPVYMQLVGAFLWVANMCDYALVYPSGQLARALSNPSRAHFRAAIRILCYLRSQGARPLVFAPIVALGFDAFVDASWLTKFSCSGAMFFYHGCLFAWFSKTQRSISLSSAEAEFFGAMLAVR